MSYWKAPPSRGYKKRRRSGQWVAPRKRRAPARLQAVPRTTGGITTTERKYFDSGLDDTAVVITADTWAGCEMDPATLNCLFAPTEGNGIENRVGQKVFVHKITVRGIMYIADQTDLVAYAHNPSDIRMILYIDQQTNATQAQAEELISSATTVGDAIHMFQNTANFGRFRVLRDKIFPLTITNGTFDGTNIESASMGREFKWTVKFRKPLQVRFNATNGGTVADIVDNSFHMIAHAMDIGTQPFLLYKTRVVFTDP